jgi:hypothetical protein
MAFDRKQLGCFMRYGLRTLLVVLALAPPVLAGLCFAGAWALWILTAAIIVAHLGWEWFIIRRKSHILRAVIAVGLFGLLAGAAVFLTR